LLKFLDALHSNKKKPMVRLMRIPREGIGAFLFKSDREA